MHRFRSFLAVLLIIAVYLLFTNAMANQHSHLLLNGEIITHAHPYTPDKNNPSPFQSHKHNSSDLTFLFQISNPNIVLGTILAILSVFLFHTRIKKSKLSVDPIVDLYMGLVPNRAPPTIV